METITDKIMALNISSKWLHNFLIKRTAPFLQLIIGGNFKAGETRSRSLAGPLESLKKQSGSDLV
jgi:hypothetical protein